MLFGSASPPHAIYVGSTGGRQNDTIATNAGSAIMIKGEATALPKIQEGTALHRPPHLPTTSLVIYSPPDTTICLPSYLPSCAPKPCFPCCSRSRPRRRPTSSDAKKAQWCSRRSPSRTSTRTGTTTTRGGRTTTAAPA